ncbi:DUF6114 domain-containing protein [Agromyces larvae]|uniref:DUF6114 domain-containing protein n=1 Tax=Agromyces larvae TaxID=2929802 RepID=A0ABY4C2R0_9MICO|nr:DUF6114 domain-containing protein [Agromyces larvae]UOE45727.1 DUF6114 domain-containing protein [Agromyces larvae]
MTMDAQPDALTSPFDAPARTARRGRARSRTADESGRFPTWFRSRPTIGGLITVLGGVAMFFSSQLQLGGMTVHVGIEGAQAMILPAVLVVCGLLAILSPAQHVFYGIVALIISVYSLVGVNLGGFFIGFLLGAVGGVIVVSWRRKAAAGEAGEAGGGSEASAASEIAEVRA